MTSVGQRHGLIPSARLVIQNGQARCPLQPLATRLLEICSGLALSGVKVVPFRTRHHTTAVGLKWEQTVIDYLSPPLQQLILISAIVAHRELLGGSGDVVFVSKRDFFCHIPFLCIHSTPIKEYVNALSCQRKPPIPTSANIIFVQSWTDHTVPAIVKSRISDKTCSTRLSRSPLAYCSRVSASRYCCTCAILEYASAQNLSWIFTNASKLGSR